MSIISRLLDFWWPSSRDDDWMVMMMMRESSRKKGESQRKSRSSIYVLDTPHTTDDVKIKVMRRSFLWSYNATLTRVCDKDLASKRERWIRVRVKETAQSGRKETAFDLRDSDSFLRPSRPREYDQTLSVGSSGSVNRLPQISDHPIKKSTNHLQSRSRLIFSEDRMMKLYLTAWYVNPHLYSNTQRPKKNQ